MKSCKCIYESSSDDSSIPSYGSTIKPQLENEEEVSTPKTKIKKVFRQDHQQTIPSIPTQVNGFKKKSSAKIHFPPPKSSRNEEERWRKTWCINDLEPHLLQNMINERSLQGSATCKTCKQKDKQQNESACQVYQKMMMVFSKQNQNLKAKNQFLLDQCRKIHNHSLQLELEIKQLQKKLKSAEQKARSYKDKSSMRKQQIQAYKVESTELKTFLLEFINLIRNINTSSLASSKQEILFISESLSNSLKKSQNLFLTQLSSVDSNKDSLKASKPHVQKRLDCCKYVKSQIITQKEQVQIKKQYESMKHQSSASSLQKMLVEGDHHHGDASFGIHSSKTPSKQQRHKYKPQMVQSYLTKIDEVKLHCCNCKQEQDLIIDEC